MTEPSHIEKQLDSLRESNHETLSLIRKLTEEVHGFAKEVASVVTENRYRDEKIERLEEHRDDHEKRLRKVEGSQEGNKVRWGFMIALGGAFLAFMTGVAVYIVRPLFVIMDHMQ